MKKYIIILIAFLPIHLFGQNYNELNEQDYDDISFAGVPFISIIAFEGDVNDISQLFNLNFTNISDDPVGEAKSFFHQDIEISYHGLIPNMQLGSIEVKTPNIIVEFLGEEIQIGDNISVLGYGDPSFNYQIGLGGQPHSATFKHPLYSSYIEIEFDASRTILSIKYIGLT